MVSPDKRIRPKEFDDFLKLPSPNQSPVKAKLQSMITSLSPIKHLQQRQLGNATSSNNPPMTKQFFSGTVNDGIKKVLLIGFNEDQQLKLSRFHEGEEPVTLNNCTTSKAKDGADIQMVAGDFTEIDKSDKLFTITDWSSIPTEGVLDTKIKGIQNLPQYQRVTIEAAKVMQIDDTVFLDDGRQCQNVVMLTQLERLTLWQHHVNSVELHETYKLTNMTVNTFANKNCLHFPCQCNH